MTSAASRKGGLQRTQQLQWAELLGPLSRKQEGLRITLYGRVVAAILEGKLAPGTVLPSTRHLAGELDVSRNTVIEAYDDLVSEGFLIARSRSGFVVGNVAGLPVATPAPDRAAQPPTPPARVAWQSRQLRSVIGLPRLLKTQRWRQCRYPFVYGQYDLDSFPLSQWREAERNTVAVAAIRDWAVDPYDSDDKGLIQQLRVRVLPRRGIWVGEDEILLTVGAQNALYLIAQLMVGPETVAACEDPGFPDAYGVLRMQTVNIQSVPVDAEGLAVGQLLPDVSLIYCTPSHQYPTTVTMSAARRQELYRFARQHNAIILEDDYEAELRYVDRQMPALKSIDEDGRVVYVGSFSKVIAPGLRLGFIVANRELIKELRIWRRLVLRNPPNNNQHAMAKFIERGFYDSHLQRLRRIYHERYITLEAALRKELPELSFTPLTGGSAIWLELPAGLSMTKLGELLVRRSVYVEIGDWLFQTRPQRSWARLGFSSIPKDRIPEGIAILAAVIREELQRPRPTHQP